ncbi:MAG TPA: helix-turn-helix transcriptional regulator [Pyrinomonadaceae bacterium]|jgi:transcriptional regulator with XRE-family HTH domain|nr:helix-turn-helix transcriptional regulator [Pyrinomonadaceae bacterium]
MGYVRWRPERLAEKLRKIRLALGLSLSEMLRALEVEERIAGSQISEYETGRREPPLPILLQYARAANVYIDALVDGELDLPDRIPSAKKSEGVRRRGR